MAQKLSYSVIALVFASFLSVSGWAATPNPTLVVTPPQPKWVELNMQQKTVLAPLAADWDAMEAYRRKKWIGIAQRFPSMPVGEQLRIQEQMQEWTKLTPEQRQLAREKYQTMSQLPSEKKQELKQKWEEYSNLPEEQKQKHQQQAVSSSIPKAGRVAAPGVQQPSPVVAPTEASVAASGTAPSAAEPLAQPAVVAPPAVAPTPAPSAVDADPVPRP